MGPWRNKKESNQGSNILLSLESLISQFPVYLPAQRQANVSNSKWPQAGPVYTLTLSLKSTQSLLSGTM